MNREIVRRAMSTALSFNPNLYDLEYYHDARTLSDLQSRLACPTVTQEEEDDLFLEARRALKDVLYLHPLLESKTVQESDLTLRSVYELLEQEAEPPPRRSSRPRN